MENHPEPDPWWSVQEQFRPAIESVLRSCTQWFGERMTALYLAGSVAFGEAWPGASDVDCFIFLEAAPDESDARWCESQATRLAREYPVVSEFHLVVHSVDRLRTDTTWRYLLRHPPCGCTGPTSSRNCRGRESTPRYRRRKPRGPWLQAWRRSSTKPNNEASQSGSASCPQTPVWRQGSWPGGS
ncbi:MAG: hypothetical protein COZ06_31855 [Armatimonadetes bacterium CG_4_10_14_3_um_filter_66_18]|nr:hypothetical protein [Armatimonadota bacterium]PIU89349.1 MAG: hypothetical protein COS65_28670 [Armatimonadetes bacterium CG06_land_8_20_14_3_00_66_21]PIX38334.1 MAG: hypothetical protein COZ57_30740 [Armatimonadetes bacterium CG_4_8_14_3_um_filter_66_20]PIY37957.1 MAG: hypothetical protein COZ06_31855 [Armatimonadetes bacterium CG_4_10_14_3_um_filter_66_18]PIZ31508.1 MAG: hypothetical protein COY42_32440 [Armatimonadetes bacterium CG_4_10_14_0_8_um_filter_66_14]PJB61049.1 MAG: hypothetica